MAKVLYNMKLANFDNFSQFDGATLELAKLRGNTFTLKDADGTSMVFTGEDFERTQSVVTGGTISGAQFLSANGKVLYTFEELSADALAVYKAFTLDKDPMRIIHGLMEGDDVVNGGNGNDNVWGFDGNDTLIGQAGNDRLFGNDGNDILKGWGGNDRLAGQSGDDTLIGGKGRDAFVFAKGSDHDTVTDFNVSTNENDRIRMDYYLFDDIVYTESNGSVTLTLPSGDELTLLNVAQAQIEGTTKFFDFY